MNSKELRQKYLKFFEEKGHKVIPSASLVPANDPTVLFTTAGMHPLVPYLLGQEHPAGKRLTNVQKSLRTDDIDEVGDDTHNTFFEMLGNWSLGDYWKEEAIKWSYEFLTDPKWLGLEKEKLKVTIFAGDADAPKDEESAKIWKSLGFDEDRIEYLGKKDNWWGPPGQTGPCGPDTEIFYKSGKKWVEIWNNVFMQYNKTIDGKFEPLTQRNVDTGMGMERTTAVLEGKDNIYDTELFAPIMAKIKEKLPSIDLKSQRIVADHIRASVFLLAEGIKPSKKNQGYVLRKLIRRFVTYGGKVNLGFDSNSIKEIAQVVIDQYKVNYPELNSADILPDLSLEVRKFRATLEKGLKMIEGKTSVTGKEAFDLVQSHGFPIELIRELVKVDEKEFLEMQKKHQELSRTTSAGMFKGGLANQNEKTIKLHTAHHLLLAALQKVISPDIKQRGSNIKEERLRIDFNFERKLSPEELSNAEDLVNQKIQEDLTVLRVEMPKEYADLLNAQKEFGKKYEGIVSIYFIVPKEFVPFSLQSQKNIQAKDMSLFNEAMLKNAFSIEFCGGPHVEHTGVIGKFKIQKEEAVSAGVRRIKAIIE